ncbi:M20/M25/M40 family metallo-hydrolase [Novosphingobium sp. PASSN1]|uniref:M20/M25/M40 family metallo-hydrolase n=1 Tax=Novosphingobium sp. PASSN1 TaxID=2015561 RepID=UPI000BCF8739|nr:M20/M25/M40 family metallo-hydrolase [Novosphingobium sp. PASSN1]OYU33355.1 MAG: peptidase M20 [Novosphingobium sp. PASSN1]
MNKRLALLAALILGVLLGIRATTPPAPVGTDAPPQVFAAGRAMADVRVIAAGPHLAASPENAAVRAHIAARMRQMGMTVREARFTARPKSAQRLARWSGKDDPAPTLTNVIGVLPGRDPSLPAVLLMAHHDTVGGSPGAADDTAGVAALLETVRALRAGPQQARDLIVLMTDGEETGLDGAHHFFNADPLRAHVGAVINVEARGGGGRTTLFETSAENGAAIARAAGAIARPGGSSLAVFIYKVLPNDTDLSETRGGPWTTYNFAFIGRPQLYHSPKATPDALDQGALQDMGAQVLDLTRDLLRAEPLPGKAADVVFFDVFRLGLLAYPAWAGWLMIAYAAVRLVQGARHRGDVKTVAVGAGRMLALIVLAGVVLWAVNQISLAPGKPNYYDRLAAIPRLEVMALCGGLAAFLLTMGAQKPTPAVMAGAALPLFVLGLVLQVVAPTAGYVVVLPMMFTAEAIAAARKDDGISWAGAMISGAPILGYMLSLGHQVMQGVGPGLPVAAVLPLAVASLAVLPLWEGISAQKVRIAAAVLLVAALGTALTVRLDPLADTVPVYSADK